MSLKLCNFDKTFHRGQTDFQFQVLEEYLQLTEAALPDAKKKAFAEFGEYIQTHSPSQPELEDLGLQMISLSGKYNLEFTSRLRYSFVIQLMSLFEERCLSFSEAVIEKEKSTAPKLSKGNTSLVTAFQNWINAYTGGHSELWDKIEILNRIRNCIVHSSGNLAKDSKSQATKDSITNHDHLTIDDDGYIVLDTDFCGDSMKLIYQLFNDLYESLGFGEPFHFGCRLPTNAGVIIDSNFTPAKIQVYEFTASGIEKLLPE